MLKQSGPVNGVKPAVTSGGTACTSAIIMALALFALTACGSVWHNAHKSALDAASDERSCAREAEETVMTRAGTARTEYGARPAQSSASLNRGESPMELHERSQTTMAYNREFESCMKAKGYTRTRFKNSRTANSMS